VEVCSRLHARLVAYRDCQLQPTAQRFHLPSKLLEQPAKVDCVFQLREFPVHIDPIEDSRLHDAGAKMAAQK
jgi:hypothetical protein